MVDDGMTVAAATATYVHSQIACLLRRSLAFWRRMFMGMGKWMAPLLRMPLGFLTLVSAKETCGSSST